MKTETLEEASERILLGEDLDLSDYDKRHILKAMVNIANWQAERMYSEEEVFEMMSKCPYVLPTDIKNWFEQNLKRNKI